MSAPIGPKELQRKALREAQHAARQQSNTCLQTVPVSQSNKSKIKSAAKVAKARSALKAITNVTNVTNVTNKRLKSETTAGKERVMAWREENPDRYLATQRELMRKRRAAVKSDA